MKRRLSILFIEFFEGERTGGLILIACTLISLIISNTRFGNSYIDFWQRPLDLSFLSISLNHSIAHWINDGLMTVFFLLVGLEIERELYVGEISDLKSALLPIFAAFGGMVVPALIHLSLNMGAATQPGIGIPVATDIAFALGVLSLLGNKTPVSLKIFLTALAIIDDLGAMVVIALFYARGFSPFYFTAAMIVFAVLIALNRLRVNSLWLYVLGGAAVWFFMLKSGVHATIAGVILAFAIPFGKGDSTSPSYKMQHYLDKPVPFLILPAFALANTCVPLSVDSLFRIVDRNTIGIFGGLLLGKPLGILAFSLIAVKSRLCKLPTDLTWPMVFSIGILGGIGFTMSIFITNLAFHDGNLIENSKIAILCASTFAGLIGYLFLRGNCPGRKNAGKSE